MAREAEKTGRESGKAKTNGSPKTEGSSEARARAGTGAAGAGEEKAGEDNAGNQAVREFQAERHKELKGALAKRSEEGANMPAIVKQFAAVWLPHHMVEVELLVPELEDADVEEDKRAAVAIRKDLLNILLADLIQSGAVDGASAKLDALSDALEAVIAASQQEAETIDESTLNELGPQMNARYERLKERFADIDESIEEAMSLLAPRSLSVGSRRQQGQMQKDRRESGRPRYSSMPDRDERGRSWEDERRYSRSGGGYRGGQQRDEEGRFMNEGRRFRSRYEDEDDGRSGGGYGGGYGGGRRSMGRERDEEGGRYGERSSSEYGGRLSGEYGSRWSGEGRERGQGGWHGDPEGHSQASRRGWEEGQRSSHRRDEDDDRYARRGEGGGRYGRSSGYEDDDRSGSYGGRYESRSGGGQEDDDERYERSGRGRGGRGGWSGDPEGHAEAARKGWEHRR